MTLARLILATTFVVALAGTQRALAVPLQTDVGAGGGGTGGLFDTGTPGFDLDIEPLPPPPIPQTITIDQRRPNELTMFWFDAADDEDDNVLVRRAFGKSWMGDRVEVHAFGPLSGAVTFTDVGLLPATGYCYQIRVDRDGVSRYSPSWCAYTRDENDAPVIRAQIEITTADVDDAGTDSPVSVALQSRTTVVRPSGNLTYLDYGGNDFKRGETQTYDLLLTGLGRVSDITAIDVRVHGDDELCIQALALIVNGTEIYRENHGGACVQVGSGYRVYFDDLRADPRWVAPALICAPRVNWIQDRLCHGLDADVMRVSRAELESRIEGILGDVVQTELEGVKLDALNKALTVDWTIASIGWGKRNGDRYVESQLSTVPGVVDVDLDLEAEIRGFNASVDVDFELVLTAGCTDAGTMEIALLMQNPRVSIDFPWYIDLLTLDQLASYIEARVAPRLPVRDFHIPLKQSGAEALCAFGVQPAVALRPGVDGDFTAAVQLVPPGPNHPVLCFGLNPDAPIGDEPPCTCGDGIIDAGEMCDGDVDCDPGSAGGALITCRHCTRSDYSKCKAPPVAPTASACGDGTIDPGEVCDGDLPCPMGSAGGAFIACLDCSVLDASACATRPPALPCEPDRDCVDDDPCTVDLCADDGSCTWHELPDPDDGLCRVRQAKTICISGDEPTGFDRRLARRIARAERLLTRLGEASTSRSEDRIRRRLLVLARQIEGLRARGEDRLTPQCRSALGALHDSLD